MARYFKVYCPICKSEAKNIIWIYKYWQIIECCECELQFSWPFELGNLEYYAEHQTHNGLYEQVKNGNTPPGNFAMARQTAKVVQLVDPNH